MPNNPFPSLDANPFDGHPHGWIQWKGTNVCMDVYCECGEQFHIDAGFCYYVKCLQCKAVYEVGGHVKLYKLEHEPENCVCVDPDQESEMTIESFFNEEN